MPPFNDAQTEAQLKRWMRPDAHRYIRPDWRRFWNAGHENDPLYRFYESVERKFSPDQPRVPAGSSDGGQWTSDGSSSNDASPSNETSSSNDASPPPTQPRLYVAAGLPRIPPVRPPTSGERTAIAKAVAIALAEAGIAATNVGEAIAKSSWLYYALPSIASYVDAPKTLDELQQDASTSKPGYDRHHIVEQSSAEEDGYPRRMIDAPDNLARIPRMKHWEINAWYQTANREYDDVSPREYLSGKDWDERRRVGLSALRRFGVLKP
ncbi:MAG: hypothetical protein QOD40_845 [Alphaproteobacteria bacterium]|jgi:hypothetical protein|nr:hypothetical protein [Alphaproteobacteria bacterium]